MDKYGCVVIGAGVGGLTAAAALAKNGMKPLVIERHNSPGGYASSFVRGRFEFETALHMWYQPLMQGVVNDMLGVEEEIVDLPQECTWAYRDEDGTCKVFDIPMENAALRAKLREIMPGCGKNIDEFFDICGEMVAAAMPSELGEELSPEEFDKRYPHFKEFNNYTVQEAYDRLGTPQILQDLINTCWYYEGPAVNVMPFGRYAGVIFLLFTQKLQYPMNRSNGLTASFEDIIRKNGGDIWYNTAVTRINVENGKVTGIETDHGDKVSTGIVVSNADPKMVYGELIGDRSQVKDYTLQLNNSIPENFSFAIVYMGLDATAEELGLKNYNIFVNEVRDPRIIERASYTLDGPYGLDGQCFNAGIPDFTEEGTCIFSIGVPLRGQAFEGLSQKEYMEAKDRIAMRAVKSFEEILGVELQSHIEEVEVATPVTLARYGGHRYGSLGYEQTMTNMAPVRALLKEEEHYIEGLYLVGQFEDTIGYGNIINGALMGQQIAASVKGGK